MTANPEREKTDECVTAFLTAQNSRLSGAAFKIVFEITMRWRFAETDVVKISYEAFEDETGLSRNTVRAGIAEAKTNRSIFQTRVSGRFAYRPNIAPVQILHRPNIAPVQKSDGEKLFERWAVLFPSPEAFDEGKRGIAERILKVKTFAECVRAAEGYTLRDSETAFEEIFKTAESVEQGIILYEFLETSEEET